MNLKIQNSPYFIPNNHRNQLVDSISGTVLFEERYYDNINSKIQGTLTTSYKSNYLNTLIVQACSFPSITDKQKSIILSFFESIKVIAGNIHPETLKIHISKSNDEEICIYRKSDDGISMIAIDEDGDGFYNFTGYQDGLETTFFENERCDFEKLTYNFLTK